MYVPFFILITLLAFKSALSEITMVTPAFFFFFCGGAGDSVSGLPLWLMVKNLPTMQETQV